MAPTKTCEDCGQTYEPAYRAKQSKYCRLCQITGRVLFVEDRVRECWVCERAFAPLSHDHKVCVECRPIYNKHTVAGDCDWCKREGVVLLGEDVRVCGRCATDPAKRRDLIRALVRKRKERRGGGA